MEQQQKKEFLSQLADGNVMRLAQALLAGDPHVRHQITHAARQLAKFPYVKDLTVEQLYEAINMISDKKIE
jgi:hypothetical protein